MEKLIRGLVRFRQVELPKRRAMFEQLGAGQDPDTLLLACADSRVVPHLTSSMEPGELFTVRTVGNLIAPAGADGVALGDVSEAAAVEYALLVLNVKDVVVYGHSKCGAMSAALSGKAMTEAPNLMEWLRVATPTMERVKRAELVDHSLPFVEQLSQVNVLQQLDHLRTYRPVAEREDAGELHLHGWWFDVTTGETHVYDSDRGGFVLLDETEAERILSNAVPAPHLTFTD
ncbi:MAG: carbonic anhydrase [Sandaracinaceae bacterium]|nr:carbonic anhydrase [Sandaracinaceae bacterium]